MTKLRELTVGYIIDSNATSLIELSPTQSLSEWFKCKLEWNLSLFDDVRIDVSI